MTWTYAGDYGSGAEKVSSTEFVLFQSGLELVEGDVVVVMLACDNLQTTDGNSSTVSDITGTYIGTFTKALEYTNSGGSAGSGVVCSVWYARVGGTIAPGFDEIFITFSGAVTAKAAFAKVFHATNSAITVAAAEGSVNDTDPALMTISSLPSQEYLFIRSAATERGSFGSIESTNYTSFGANTTNSPGDDTDVQIFAEYRIFTGTGDSTDPTTGTPESASVYLALKEAAPIVDYTLPAEVLDYPLTLNATNFNFGYTLQAGALNYDLTLFPVELLSALSLVAESLNYSLTLNDVTLLEEKVYVMQAETLNYALRLRNTLLLGPGTGTVAGPTSVRQEDGYRYEPGRPPENATVDEALQWALQELQKAGNVINNLAGGKVEVTHVEPKKPRAGMIRMADGTDWNPGFGRGYYGYDDDSGTWKPLFQTSP